MPGHFALKVALVTVLVAGSVALALHGAVLAQEAPQVTSLQVTELPPDPNSLLWSAAPAATVTLIPQAAIVPRIMQVSVPTVAVRSLNDGQRIAFLLEWADTTRDARATRPDEFRDAAAILLPVGDFAPNVCMGSPGQLTTLWHWKADWQEDIDRGFQDVVDAYPNFYKDRYPFVTGTPPYRVPADFASGEAQQYFIGQVAGNPLSQPEKTTPVEVLISSGFGTATHQAQQDVQGRGVWADGRWRVMFVRALAAGGPESPNLAGRADVPAAFAVWNGANQEVGARKQLSGLVTVRLAPSAAPVPGWWPFAAAAVLILLAGGGAAIVVLRRRQWVH